MTLRTNLTNGAANGLAVINALLDAVGQSRTNQQKSDIVDKIVSHYGLDPAELSNAEKGSAFIDAILRDIRARLRAQGQKEAEASRRSAIDADAAAVEALIE